MGFIRVAVLSAFVSTGLAIPGPVTALRGAESFPDPQASKTEHPAGKDRVVLAGGCFWEMESLFGHVKGVESVVSGYAGGEKKTAHVALVETGNTGHAESVMITYDPSKLSYAQLLKIFFSVAHDPTQKNRQGEDRGSQYRSAIFYRTDEQKQVAEAYIKQLDTAMVLPTPIVTEVTALDGFYPAEPSLQHYSQRHPDDPYVLRNDPPKLDALRKMFPELYK